MIARIRLITILFVSGIFITACGGLRTFHDFARVGDTIAIPVGMQPDFSKENIIVTITPSSGPQITLPSTHPAIRGIVNFYPDPISSIIVSNEINEDITPSARDYFSTVNYNTDHDKDWFQTTVFLDLPNIPTGLTQIEVSNGAVIARALTLDIIDGTGTPNTFLADILGLGSISLTTNMVDAMSRSNHTTIDITSNEIPHAIEILLTHDPDASLNGTGKALAVNPLGHRKNLYWSDDGINMKIILMESKSGIIDNMNDYKFYVAGTVTNLLFSTINGYDINGELLVEPVSATLTHNTDF